MFCWLASWLPLRLCSFYHFFFFLINLDKIWYIVMTCWCVQAHAKFVCMINIHRWVHLDAYEPFTFKLGMMVDMTDLYILISVWMSLTFTQGHRLMRTLELVKSFCWKVAQSYTNICRGWLCKDDDCREKYGEYGSFEHLFFLFSVSLLSLCGPSSVFQCQSRSLCSLSVPENEIH